MSGKFYLFFYMVCIFPKYISPLSDFSEVFRLGCKNKSFLFENVRELKIHLNTKAVTREPSEADPSIFFTN